MHNIFSSILKQKKAVFFALLFFVVMAVFLPVAVSAVQTSQSSTNTFSLSGLPRKIALTIATMLIVLPFLITTYVFRMLAGLTYGLLEYVLNQMIEDPQQMWAITQNAGIGIVFVESWNIVKNYGNILIVLGFIAIAVATILRFREYEAKKLLIPLIVIALLVNFSGVFIGLMIDASNIVMQTLVTGSEQEGQIIPAINSARNNIATPLYVEAMETIWSSDDWATPFYRALGYVGVEAIFSIIYATIAVTFFLLFLIFVERYIMLAILFILSPLAFVFYVFPITKKHFSTWWNHFLKWCFAGLVAAFFLRLSVKVLTSRGINNWQTNPGDEMLDVMPRIIMQLIIVLGFIIAGYKLARKSSLIASAVIDTAKATTKMIAGVVGTVAKPVLKWGADNTGLTRAKNAAQYGITRAGEALRVVNRGTAAANWEAKNKGIMNEKGRVARVNALTDQELARELSNPQSILSTVKGQKDRAAMYSVLERRGKLGMLSDADQMEALRISQKYQNQEDTQKIAKSMSTANQGRIVTAPRNLGAIDNYEQTVRDAALGSLASKGQINTLPQANLMGALERSRANGMNLKEVIGKLNAENKAHILTTAPNNLLNQDDRDAALTGLAADKQLNRLSAPVLVSAMNQSLGNGLDLKDVIKALDGLDAAQMLENDEFDGPTRAKILEALAEKRQTDLLQQGELIYQTIQAQTHGVKPENIVKNMSSENQAHIVNNRPPLLSPEARGAAVEGLRKKKELNRIDATNRPVAYGEALQYGGSDIGDLEKGDHRAAPLNEERMRRLRSANPTLAQPQLERLAVDEALDENIGSYSDEQLIDIDATSLEYRGGASPEYQRVKKLTPEKISKFQNATGDQQAALKMNVPALDTDMVNEMEDALNAKLGFPSGTTESQRTASLAITPHLPPYDANLINIEQSRHHTAEAGKLRATIRAIGRLP